MEKLYWSLKILFDQCALTIFEQNMNWGQTYFIKYKSPSFKINFII